MNRRFAAGMLALAALMIGPPSAHAGTVPTVFVVDDLGDDGDAANNSTCATAATVCTLRAALEEADALAQPVTVRFAPGVAGGTITPASDLLYVPGNVDLNGCSGNETSPCMQINGASAAAPMAAGGDATVAGLAFAGSETALTLSGSVTVRNNWFGIGLDGANVPQLVGVSIDGGTGVVIGGTADGDRNVFANNVLGVALVAASDTTIAGNFFGTNNVGTAAPIAPQAVAPAGNGDGVAFDGSGPGDITNTTIGTTVSPAAQATTQCDGGCNLFARGKAQFDDRGEGIDLFGTSNGFTADDVAVRGNFFGLDVSGTQLLANEGAGINVGPIENVTVGGADPGARNVMAGGPQLITGSFAFPKLVENNYLGLNSAGTAAFPSTTALLDVRNSLANGSPVIRGNRLGGTSQTPLGIRLTGSQGGTVTGNVLGVGTGGEALPFGSAGIRVDPGGEGIADSALDFVIGGDDAASENVISNVAGDAIQIVGGRSNGNTVLRNRGGGNSGLFVDVGTDGAGDSTQANGGAADPPIGIAHADRLDGTFTAPGTVVRAYTASAAAGSIDAFLGQATSNANGDFTVPFSSAQPNGQLITFNATSGAGSSEFRTVAVGTGVRGPGPGGPPGGGPPGGGGGGGPVLDGTKPRVSSFAVRPSSFRAAKSGASVAGSPRTGTAISYRLSEPARTSYTVEQATTGRKSGRRCVKQTRRNRKNKKCTIWKKLSGGFAHSGATGANTFRFTGRLRNKTLKPGSYRLVAQAQDAAGNKSAVTRKAFKIIK